MQDEYKLVDWPVFLTISTNQIWHFVLCWTGETLEWSVPYNTDKGQIRLFGIVNWRLSLWKILYIPLQSGVIDYQNESIMHNFFMHNFAILLVKMNKSNPCQKWSRGSPQPNDTNSKCTSGFIIHVTRGFGWWLVDFGCILMYGVKKWKVFVTSVILLIDNLIKLIQHN